MSVRSKPLDFLRSELTEYEVFEEEAISRSATVWEEINEKCTLYTSSSNIIPWKPGLSLN